MTEAPDEPDYDDAEPEPGPPGRTTTGHASVEEVIRAVEELDDRPIEEHVGVFEAAQAELRRALDDPGDDGEPADSGH
jgi:hypothetical protein